MTIHALQNQINAKADARLRGKIDAKLDPLRQELAHLPALVIFEAAETSQTAQPVEVSMTAVELVNILADFAVRHRRDQARTRATKEFLEKLEAAGITP